MADVAVQPGAEQAQRPWPAALRILFRFVCCYWVLYALPDSGRVNIFYEIPGASYVFKPYVSLCHAVTPWVAVHLFHVTGRAATYFRTGSGDTTLQYVQELLFAAAAAAGALIWSVLDRRRKDYRTVHGWLRLLVRYMLAFTLFAYGFAKVFPLQFQPPGFARLIEPYGEFSPMGALWWFMGASIPYIIFSGTAEVTGGLLLLFRRTTTLGAMVATAVMANVVALNFCYDVPVKLYSTNILLMALFLLAPDGRRLAKVLVFNRSSEPADLPTPRFGRRWTRIVATVFWVLFVGANLVGHVVGGWGGYKSAYVNPTRPPLYGLYDVESGPAGWRKVAIQFPGAVTVRETDDTVLNLQASYDKDAVTLGRQGTYRWSRPDADHVLLEGGGAAPIRLRKIDTGKFLLVSRGFHWINEMPLNK